MIHKFYSAVGVLAILGMVVAGIPMKEIEGGFGGTTFIRITPRGGLGPAEIDFLPAGENQMLTRGSWDRSDGLCILVDELPTGVELITVGIPVAGEDFSWEPDETFGPDDCDSIPPGSNIISLDAEGEVDGEPVINFGLTTFFATTEDVGELAPNYVRVIPDSSGGIFL